MQQQEKSKMNLYPPYKKQCNCNGKTLNGTTIDSFNLGNVASVGITIDNITALKLAAVIITAQVIANLITR